ncbi:hypothetical protein QN415_21980 [Pseudomonas sp. 5S4]|nr:hypothetical protein [Pseudomonas sp. 10S5]MEA9978054.1 hypothetical protein [Pseudomonas sp. RTS4]MEB0199859.1 hypothetical protein [Pseudomonas sp. 5S4]MEB0246487.1 hypothetical protein [Pseudomonas sp. 10S5]
MSNVTNSTTLIISNEMLRPSADKKAENSQRSISFAETLSNATNKMAEIPYVRSARATEVRDWIMSDANNDSERAGMWAQLYGCDSLDGPLIDVSDEPIIRLSATGEVYTKKMQTYYEQVRQNKQPGLAELYRSEIAKNTPAIEVLKKVFAYYDALPNEFKRMADL